MAVSPKTSKHIEIGPITSLPRPWNIVSMNASIADLAPDLIQAPYSLCPSMFPDNDNGKLTWPMSSLASAPPGPGIMIFSFFFEAACFGPWTMVCSFYLPPYGWRKDHLIFLSTSTFEPPKYKDCPSTSNGFPGIQRAYAVSYPV